MIPEQRRVYDYRWHVEQREDGSWLVTSLRSDAAGWSCVAYCETRGDALRKARKNWWRRGGLSSLSSSDVMAVCGPGSTGSARAWETAMGMHGFSGSAAEREQRRESDLVEPSE